jgi:folate-binding protein YgfZ
MATAFSEAVAAARDGAAWARRHDLAFISVQGKDRVSFLHGLLSADIKKVELGTGTGACLLTAKGGLVAPLAVHHLPEEHLLAGPVESAPAAAEMLRKMAPLSDCKVEVHDLAAWLVAGARRASVLEALAGRPCDPGPGGLRAFPTSAGVVGVFTDFHSGLDAFLVTVPAAAAERFEGVLAGAVEAAGAVELPEAALEALRVEKGMPAWGREAGPDVFPQEVRLDSWVSQDKGCYLGQEMMARLRDRGHVNKLLVGLRLAGPAAPGDPVESETGEPLGKVTSVAPGDLALAFVKRDAARPGASYVVAAGPRKVAAAYQELPL